MRPERWMKHWLLLSGLLWPGNTSWRWPIRWGCCTRNPMWWAVDLELRHTWLQPPVAPLTQALGQVNCGFLIYELGVNTSNILRQIVRIQWPIKHMQNACYIHGVNKCSILSSPSAWTKFILVTKSIPSSILEECIWDIGAAISQKEVILDRFFLNRGFLDTKAICYPHQILKAQDLIKHLQALDMIIPILRKENWWSGNEVNFGPQIGSRPQVFHPSGS